MRAASPIRILTAVPLCDGHDSAISTINLEMIRHGIEVVYLGYHRAAADIARAAVQEDVRAIGLSSYNGGHVEFFAEVQRELKKRGGKNIALFGGGGGTISRADAKLMMRRGVKRIFFPGTPLGEMVEFVKKEFGGPADLTVASGPLDRRLARLLSNVIAGKRRANKLAGPPVIGVTGPGGAGKTTLIDELVLRYLRRNSSGRIAVLSHDPSILGTGALLGDRAAMLYCQSDRVFLRSLSTAGRAGGLASMTRRCIDVLRMAEFGFDAILVETVGIGQEALPFGGRRNGLVDQTVVVMTPEYGSQLQLQKIAVLDTADLVAVNKSDMASSRTAVSEIEQRLGANLDGRQIISTVAKCHGDGGVDRLFDLLLRGTGFQPVS